MGTLALDGAALLLYPGLLTVAVAGVLGELAQAVAAGRPAPPAVLLRPLLRRPPVTALAAAALGALAAVQLAAPYSPFDGGDRNLLVAAFAAGATAWLAWAWDPGEDGRLLFVGLAGWLVALLAPAVLAQDLRPQALGNLTVGALLPAKVAAAALYLVSLPAAAGLLGRGLAREQRLWLWLPGAGLFASVYLPPAPDDLFGLVRFFAAAAAAAVLAVLVARAVRGAAREAWYARGVVLLLAVTLGLAVVAAAFRT